MTMIQNKRGTSLQTGMSLCSVLLVFIRLHTHLNMVKIILRMLLSFLLAGVTIVTPAEKLYDHSEG